MARCSSCGAEIHWARTENGRRIPMDPGAHEDGNLARVGRLINGDIVVEFVKPGFSHRDPLRFRSHFASCPQADEHRRKRNR